jgi:uncharacterized protein YbcC (UPF0753/DUF2309 family)
MTTDLAPLPAGIDLERVIAAACDRIAPLWPLKNFVAVNPFLGFTQQSFHATCATLYRVARADMLMPRSFYREALASGRFEDVDIAAALSAAPPEWQAPVTVDAFKAALFAQDTVRRKHPAHVPSVAETLDALAAGNRQVSGTGFMIDEISKFCAAYFDEGQTVWQLPERDRKPYHAWRAAMQYDRNPEVMGIAGFRRIVASMPEDPVAAIAEVVKQQGVPARALVEYLHQTLLDISGWASYARYLAWQSELVGQTNDVPVHLLAIRVVWGYALFMQRTDAAFRSAWKRAMDGAASMPLDDRLGDDPELCIDIIAQEAYEGAYTRRLLATLAAHAPRGAVESGRPQVQAAFCIDVRSEIFRRALEQVAPSAQTLGFAGFFGYPIEYVPIGHQRGGAQCPVLLTPAFTIRQVVQDVSDEENAEILGLRLMRRRIAKAWKSFKLSAVSSFIFVKTGGMLFVGKLLTDSLALTRPATDPNTDGLDPAAIRKLGPEIEARTDGGRVTGFPDHKKIDMAEAVLGAMSLRSNFAPLVMMTGHGSTTVNNPHASGLDCGACGGHTGEANARVAADICNDPDVRAGLRARGLDIPNDTWFLGCLHDTTTDEITIFDEHRVPASHRTLLADVRARLREASALTRRERAPQLGIPLDDATDRRVFARSRDWAQVRPEWALANNASFIAAPRAFTRGIDLAGRAFLHDYRFDLDASGSVLELIMTAPMVVASWINLQYYGSVVNNRLFGAGNKVLHNVTGCLGVLEGNAGDLRVGLPWQSVHDGERFIHEPQRLSVFIAAPTGAMDAVIRKHEAVRHLLDHRWLRLFAMDPISGAVTHRYEPECRWLPAD